MDGRIVADFPARRLAARAVAELTGRKATYPGLDGQPIDSEQTPKRPFYNQPRCMALFLADRIARELALPALYREGLLESNGLDYEVSRLEGGFKCKLADMLRAELKRRGLLDRLVSLPARQCDEVAAFYRQRTFAVACEALAAARTLPNGDGFQSTQEFKVLRVLAGEAPAGATLMLRYCWFNEPWTGERPVAAGERVIWAQVGRHKDGQEESWWGYYALPDTPANRRAVQGQAARP